MLLRQQLVNYPIKDCHKNAVRHFAAGREHQQRGQRQLALGLCTRRIWKTSTQRYLSTVFPPSSRESFGMGKARKEQNWMEAEEECWLADWAQEGEGTAKEAASRSYLFFGAVELNMGFLGTATIQA